jgi:hypothetical protein
VHFSERISYRRTAMPCRCKSVGESFVPGSPCLITQSRASSRQCLTPSSRHDSVVFHHLRFHLTERRRSNIRFQKVKASSKSPSEEGDEDVFTDCKVKNIVFSSLRYINLPWLGV